MNDIELKKLLEWADNRVMDIDNFYYNGTDIIDTIRVGLGLTDGLDQEEIKRIKNMLKEDGVIIDED